MNTDSEQKQTKGTKEETVLRTPGFDALHLWWELSYAQYLTIPRSVMQSMPDEWQAKMAALLNELDETIEWRPSEGLCYMVELRGNVDQEGFQEYTVRDPLADYQRGRRQIPRKGAA